MGKLSSHFIRAKSSDFKETDRHAGILEWPDEPIPENALDFLQIPVTAFWPKRSGAPPKFLKGVLLSQFLAAHHGYERQNNSTEMVEFLKFLQACDRKSSAEDKANPSDQAKQPYLKTYRCTVFGQEELLDPQKLDELRRELWQKLSGIPLLRPIYARRRLLPLLEHYFSSGLAETRRSANDLNLYHHSYSVATYFKIGLVSYLLGERLPQDMEEIEQAILTVEIEGEPSALDLKKLRYLLEERYPLGNYFFQDYNRYFFLVAPLSIQLKEKLKKVANEKLGRRTRWEYFLISEEGWRFPLPRPKLTVPQGQAGIALGLGDFIRNDYFDTIFSKTLEHIEENLNFPELVKRTKQILDLTRFEKAEELRSDIRSLSRHLQNLEKGLRLGRLTPLKQKEYLVKRKKLNLMKRELTLLRKGENLKRSFSDQEEWENFRQRMLLFVDRVFSWLHPPDPVQIARSWESGDRPALIALRYILRKGPSFSRLLAMTEECQKFMNSLSQALGKPLNLSPTFATFRADPEKLKREARVTYWRIFGKMEGRLPIICLPPGKYGKSLFETQIWELEKVRREYGTLKLLFKNGESWEISLKLGNGEEDHYFLYYIIRNPYRRQGKRGLHLPRGVLVPAQRLKGGDLVEVLAPVEQDLL
jgi:hypothetical protein